MVCACASSAHSQAAVISERDGASLLQATRRWSQMSPLGDLRQIPFGPDDIEVRAWGGFGFGPTRAIVLRRESGRWRAAVASEVRCWFSIPIPVGDTASQTTLDHYVIEARMNCGGSSGELVEARG